MSLDNGRLRQGALILGAVSYAGVSMAASYQHRAEDPEAMPLGAPMVFAALSAANLIASVSTNVICVGAPMADEMIEAPLPMTGAVQIGKLKA